MQGVANSTSQPITSNEFPPLTKIVGCGRSLFYSSNEFFFMQDIIIDLLKESLLNSTTERGFVISNFPRNAKQAELFMKEIGKVSFILHLHSNMSCLINRAQEKSEEKLNEDALKRSIVTADSYVKLSLVKFANKVENVRTVSLTLIT